MRSKIAEKLAAETPEDLKIFVDKQADMIVRVNELIQAKGVPHSALAKDPGPKSSEISKWLSGNYPLTLRSIAKLEAELGGVLLAVPQCTPASDGD